MMKNSILINAEGLENYSGELNEVIEQTINKVLVAEGFDKSVEVSVLLVHSDEIKRLNKEYRGKDAPTDVLSFPTSEEDFEVDLATGRTILGDIVLCTDVALKQAEEIGNTLSEEIRFLTIHSMLHLLFYDHETSKEDEKEMFSRQQEILEFIKENKEN
ncbi:MAG: rRNA maturation RNase YbeY [Clostridia bacterium]